AEGLESLPPSSDELDVEGLRRELRRDPAVVEALERMWPVLTPQQLLHDLFGAPPLIALAAGRVLTDEERACLYRPRAESVDEAPGPRRAPPLLDEAAAPLGPPRKRRPVSTDGEHAPDGLRPFGHIVVDEAQDLSPMQLRMLTRRSLNSSMTLVGDLAQATGH